MEEEPLEQAPPQEDPPVTDPPAQDPPAPDPSEKVDVEAIRRQAYEDGLRAGVQNQGAPAAPAKKDDPQEPEVDDDLAITDPAEYRRQIEARADFRTERMLKRQEEAFNARINPILDRLQTDVVVNDVTSGLDDVGRQAAAKVLKGVSYTQLESNPVLREVVRGYAENESRKANPVRMNPERPHSPPGGATLSPSVRRMIDKGWYTESEAREAVKNGEIQ